MRRLGVVLLIAWLVLVLVFIAAVGRFSLDTLVSLKFDELALLIAIVLIPPIIVYILWRALLWVIAGFRS